MKRRSSSLLTNRVEPEQQRVLSRLTRELLLFPKSVPVVSRATRRLWKGCLKITGTNFSVQVLIKSKQFDGRLFSA